MKTRKLQMMVLTISKVKTVKLCLPYSDELILSATYIYQDHKPAVFIVECLVI